MLLIGHSVQHLKRRYKYLLDQRTGGGGLLETKLQSISFIF